ncbi:hypothetical protein BDR03DRAFT_1035314 [Suillus americanus]|nr:hypothetical protein BDR03DRAFT_1035314 [Suillus americanus]
MHLFLENIIPQLVDLWTGCYKMLDVGSEDYELAPHVWEEIGTETAAAVKQIPAAFVRVLGNIAVDKSTFTAEVKYYTHMCKLISLMKTSVKLEITAQEINDLEQGFAEWVREFECYYYQFKEDRLAVCTLPIHGCLHVAKDLRMCGPAWVHWTFYVEQYCLHLRTGLRSRWHPWSGLSHVVLYTAYLSQLSVKFDLQDELKDLNPCHRRRELENECSFENYPEIVLRTPCRSSYTPDEDTHKRIGVYLFRVLGGRRDDLALHLPAVMPLWGKMRIIGGGDSIRTRYALRRMSNAKYRDNSFVRFEVSYSDVGESRPVDVIGYGQLDNILICEIGKHKIYRFLCNTMLILALITPCNTNGTDASISLVGYKEFVAPVVTDVQNIKAVVGRVQT